MFNAAQGAFASEALEGNVDDLRALFYKRSIPARVNAAHRVANRPHFVVASLIAAGLFIRHS
jgi:hypothetical protein